MRRDVPPTFPSSGTVPEVHTNPPTHTHAAVVVFLFFFPYREDASSRPVEGHAVHRRQVPQDPLVHLHVLVHGRGNQLPEAVGAVQPAAKARLHWRGLAKINITNK